MKSFVVFPSVTQVVHTAQGIDLQYNASLQNNALALQCLTKWGSSINAVLASVLVIVVIIIMDHSMCQLFCLIILKLY